MYTLRKAQKRPLFLQAEPTAHLVSPSAHYSGSTTPQGSNHRLLRFDRGHIYAEGIVNVARGEWNGYDQFGFSSC